MLGLASLTLLFVILGRAMMGRPGVAMAVAYLFFLAEQLVQTDMPMFLNRGWLLNTVVAAGAGLVWLRSVPRFGLRQMLALPWSYAPHLIFIAYALLSSVWSMYASVTDRVLEMAPYLVWFVVVTPLLAHDLRGTREGLGWIAWGGSILSALTLLRSEPEQDSERLYMLGVGAEGEMNLNPLAISSAAMFSLIALVFLASPRSLLLRILRFALMGISLVVAGRSGRGELLSGLLTLVVVAAIDSLTSRWERANFQRLVAYVLGFALILAVGYYGLVRTTFWHRYAALGRDASSEIRFEMISLAWRYFLDHPETWGLGAGWSSTYVICGFYPHNGIVQSMVELGVMGTSLWAISMSRVLTHGHRALRATVSGDTRDRGVIRTVVAFALFAFGTNQKSGDCLDIVLAMSIGTALVVARGLTREIQPRSNVTSLRPTGPWRQLPVHSSRKT